MGEPMVVPSTYIKGTTFFQRWSDRLFQSNGEAILGLPAYLFCAKSASKMRETSFLAS